MQQIAHLENAERAPTEINKTWQKKNHRGFRNCEATRRRGGMSWQFEASKITTSAAAKTWLRKTYPEVFASEVVKPLSYSVRSLLQQHADLAGVWRVALDSAMLDIVQ